MFKQAVKGGLAAGMDDKDIAAKVGEPLPAVEHALSEGQRVEREHTSDPKLARHIAKDHVVELGPEYYPELERMESTLTKHAFLQGYLAKRAEWESELVEAEPAAESWVKQLLPFADDAAEFGGKALQHKKKKEDPVAVDPTQAAERFKNEAPKGG